MGFRKLHRVLIMAAQGEKPDFNPHKFRLLAAALACALLLVGLFSTPGTGFAQSAPAQGGEDPGQACVVCHATPGLGMQFSDGEIISVYVDPGTWSQSVHGNLLQCTACHQDIGAYPHIGREVARPAARDLPYLVRSYTRCGECHQEQYGDYLSSSHAIALSEGNQDSAVCTDCHGDHQIQPAKLSENGLSVDVAVNSCQKCHQEEYAQYKTSVHGKALFTNADPNVPACIDCHGVHDMGDPTLAAFRRKSPYLCASCHADAELMRQYGKSPTILDTYVADFHGTTAQLFPVNSKTAPAEAMCNDCHGVHDIQSSIEIDNLANNQNLVLVCQECHPDANQNFPAAWLGHHLPAPDRSPWVFWIRQIYVIAIGAIVAALILHIVLDLGRVTLDKIRAAAGRSS